MPEQNQGGEVEKITADDVGVLELAKIDPHAPHAKAKIVVDKEIFCANCQAKTVHKMSRDKNNEMLATCDCGRALKFAMPEDPSADHPSHLEVLLNKHHEANVGQVSVLEDAAAQEEADNRFKKVMGIKE